MKELISIVILVVLTLSIVTVGGTAAGADALASPTDADVRRDDAVAAAKEEAARLLNLPVEDMEAFETAANFVYVDASDSTDWFVTFFAEGYPEPAAAVVIDAATAEVKTSHTKDFYTYTIEVLDTVWGHHNFWSLEERALFDLIYYAPSRNGKNVLPGEGFLPEADAVRIARKAIMDAFHVPEASLDALRMSNSLMAGVEDPKDATPESSTWMICYRPQQPDRDGYYTNVYQANVSALDGRVIDLYSDDAHGQW